MSSHDRAPRARQANRKGTNTRAVSGAAKREGESFDAHAWRERHDAARERADVPEQLAGVPFN